MIIVAFILHFKASGTTTKQSQIIFSYRFSRQNNLLCARVGNVQIFSDITERKNVENILLQAPATRLLESESKKKLYLCHFDINWLSYYK